MANLCKENLFLLEFLVDELKMDARCDCMNLGEMCVSFQFLDNEPLDVCEGDFNCGRKFGQDENNKTGKSCLFSLTPAQAQKVMKNFNLLVTVLKKMQPGWEPSRTCVGSACISVLPMFLELVCNPQAAASSAKVLQETHDLKDAKGQHVGKIAVYIRMSCYGKMIITQFQMNMDDKSVLFKDKDGQSLYRYKKSKRGKGATKIEDLSKNRCQPCCPSQQPSQIYQPMPQPFPQMGPSMFPPNQFGPSAGCPMQPCFPPPGGNPYGGGNPMDYPQANLNCPHQSCFPGGMGGMHEMSSPYPSSSQQNQTRRSCKSGCGGGCGRG